MLNSLVILGPNMRQKIFYAFRFQVAFVSTMLTAEYGIDKKYIDGFELPAKKKKK